jgi:hypothetical protein
MTITFYNTVNEEEIYSEETYSGMESQFRLPNINESITLKNQKYRIVDIETIYTKYHHYKLNYYLTKIK